MGPRKSASEWSNDSGYPAVLQKLCQEEDVIVIPLFVTVYTGRQSENIACIRSKDSRISERAGNSFTAANDVKGEDVAVCGNVRPQVGIVYSNPDDKESPIAIVCKNLYVEYSLINAFGKSLKPYPTINTLKIENCCISKEITEALAFLLADEPGRWISDLSLDGNEGISQMLPLFVKLPTGIKYLSLQRCSLGDEDIAALAEVLGFSDEKDQKLQVLNLGMNRIGNAGAEHLAKAFRTNRTLISLSLMGNQIDDVGASALCDVLQKFPLTYEEVVSKRKRVFSQILLKKAAVERYLEEMKAKGEDEHQVSKTSLKGGDRLTTAGRKIRGPDGKTRCMASRDQKARAALSKATSGEKFRGKGRGGGDTGVDPTPSEVLAIAQQVESETPPDKHPFTNELTASEEEICCLGCWSLANLNLSFNYLTEASARRFSETVIFQRENFKPPRTGLVRLVLLPGNWIFESSSEFQNLQLALAQRGSKKELQETLEPAAAVSVTSGRRMSSSGRRMKNR